MKKITALLLISTLMLTLVFTLVACSADADESTGVVLASQSTELAEEADEVISTAQNLETIYSPISVEVNYDSDDLDTGANSSEMSTITLAGDTITVEGNGATVNGNIVTITAAGAYNVSGVLNDGQIIVNSEDEETVNLILNGVDITYATSAPIYVSHAEKTVITLADGTENVVTDGATYLFEDTETDEPNAAIFSKDDLTINGNGSLTINATYNNGIAGKDDLKITGGNITVNAVNDGIKGKDSVAVKDGVITIYAGADGIQSTNIDEEEKGFIAIEGGVLNISATLDGIQAATTLSISDGELKIAAAGKGIEAEANLSISGGTLDVDAGDDALHSNNSLTIDGGSILLKSGDDGMHAESALTINNGEVYIAQAVEGLESLLVTINDGYVHMVTSDDGINATTGNGGEQGDSSYFYINGGYVLVNAEGDGLDSNGNAIISGGTVIVQGPTLSKNGPLDVNGSLDVNGGLLIVAGSSGMPEVPSTASAQNSIAVGFDAAQPGGTIIHLENAAGEEILTYESPKEFQLFVFSSPELQMNTTYILYVGGTATGTITNGVYSDGTYSSGTQVASLDISSNITTSGNFESGRSGKNRP